MKQANEPEHETTTISGKRKLLSWTMALAIKIVVAVDTKKDKSEMKYQKECRWQNDTVWSAILFFRSCMLDSTFYILRNDTLQSPELCSESAFYTC